MFGMLMMIMGGAIVAMTATAALTLFCLVTHGRLLALDNS
jgi:hypothetical protein